MIDIHLNSKINKYSLGKLTDWKKEGKCDFPKAKSESLGPRSKY